MEIKLASHSFKCDANRKYDQTVRRLNKPSESPIHFAFTTDYDDDSVPKCPHCRTYLFPQEVSKAMWCCKKGQMLSLYKPWTQPTDEYRGHCIGNFANAKLFRLHSRALNLTLIAYRCKRRLPIPTKFVVCDLMKLTQGQRSCPHGKINGSEIVGGGNSRSGVACGSAILHHCCSPSRTLIEIYFGFS